MEKMNRKRVVWAQNALQQFSNDTWGGERVSHMNTEDTEALAGDLLADLMHFCDASGIGFADVLEKGYFHYEYEVSEGAEEEALDDGVPAAI